MQNMHLRKLQKCKMLAIRARCCDFSKFPRPCREPLATRSRPAWHGAKHSPLMKIFGWPNAASEGGTTHSREFGIQLRIWNIK